MKSLINCCALFITLISFPLVIQKAVAQEVSVSFQVFYDDLSPYGQWVDYDNAYAWVPSVAVDFVPYSTGGYWVLTDYGYTWFSDYGWGWAPFHYGRWNFDNYYGWIWIPGYEWGPAWVAWRRCPGYYGWAPLGPGISVTLAIGGGYNIPYNYWTFLPEHYIGRRDMDHYYGPRKDNEKYFNNSTVINNTYVDNSRHSTYIAGPRKEEVEKTIGAPVNRIAVRENVKPGQSLRGNELNIYRPRISMENNSARPAKISDKRNITPVSERKSSDKNFSPNKNEPSKTNSQRQQTPGNNRQQQQNIPPPTKPSIQNPRQQPNQQKNQNIPHNQPGMQQHPNPAPRANPPAQNPRPQPNMDRNQNIPRNQQVPRQQHPMPPPQPTPPRPNPMPAPPPPPPPREQRPPHR